MLLFPRPVFFPHGDKYKNSGSNNSEKSKEVYDGGIQKNKNRNQHPNNAYNY